MPLVRSISHTEVAALLDCQAKHDMQYVGRLAGSALFPKATPAFLREGRAWGAGVAAWHATGDLLAARRAIFESLNRDAQQQKRYPGCYDGTAHCDMQGRLFGLIGDYVETTPRLPIERVPALEVPIPSRSGLGRSNAYSLRCYASGVHIDADGRAWIVDFRLRHSLSSPLLINLSRHAKWAAWAWREQTGIEPAGIIVDERLNEIPKPARILQNGRASHAKDQLTTVAMYVAACERTGAETQAETIAALGARRWHQREPVEVSPIALDAVGDDLISAAQQVRSFDSGATRPIRNPSRVRCDGCRFRLACPDPTDQQTLSLHFERRAPKRAHGQRQRGGA